MKKIGILLLVLLFLAALGFFGYKYWAAENLKIVEPQKPASEAVYEKKEPVLPEVEPKLEAEEKLETVNMIKSQTPKPSVLNEDGTLMSHPDNAIYSANPNK